MPISRFFQEFEIQRQESGDGRIPGAYRAIGHGRGFLQKQTSNTSIVNGALKATTVYVLFTRADVHMRVQDRVIYKGITYSVASGGDFGVSGLGHHNEYTCVRVNDG